MTEEKFFANFDALEEAAVKLGAFGHAAHVNLPDGKRSASCPARRGDDSARHTKRSTSQYDSITEVRRVTGADMRIPMAGNAAKRKSG